MSRMKKSLSLVLAVFAMSAVVGACSKQEAAEEPQVATEAAAEAAADAMSPQDERHELMETVKEAAQVLGPMAQGKTEYDPVAAMQALEVWRDVGSKFGDLFPDGSEGGEAAPAIWEDRDGFNAALKKWQDATAAAIAANPQTLEDAKASIGPAFGSCKNCHDSYRIEDE